MFRGIRVIFKARPTPYVCQNCQTKASRPRRPADQRRWISRNQIRNIREAEIEWSMRASAVKKGERISMLDLLEQRGYVNQIVGTRDQLNDLIINRRVGVYCGVDPTAPSLHVGHMLPFMVLGWLYIHGYSVHFLLGAATARIGDPTGRLKQRDKVHRATANANVAAMHSQLVKLGALIERHAARRGYQKEWAWSRAVKNNASWYQKLPLMDFLRTVGAIARIGPMLGRDTVKHRLEKGDGMSFAEFSYPLVQAYDWWHLFQTGVQIQVGGADQFGNILAGAEIVKQLNKEKEDLDPDLAIQDLTHKTKEQGEDVAKISDDPMGFTVPLLTTSSGEKIGKSTGNAIWIDQDMTSSYDLYQYFLRSADADVERYLKLLTFMPLSDIAILMEEHRQDESRRVAQHRLAKEFIELVHGDAAAETAEQEHRNMFRKNLSIADIRRSSEDSAPADINPALNKYAQPQKLEANLSNRLKLPTSLVDGQPLSKILWSAALVASRSEGQRLINAKGVHIGGKPNGLGAMDDALNYTPAQMGTAEELKKYIIDGQLLILRIGKWKMKIINIVSDQEYEEAGLSCPGWKVEEECKEDQANDTVQDKGFREEYSREKRFEKFQNRSRRYSGPKMQ